MSVGVIRMDISAPMAQFDRLKEIPNEVMQKALPYWIANTPIKTGNARHNTSLRGLEIVADYPYAERLDNGWSKQSPDGMTEPTMGYINKIYAEAWVREGAK